jgi:uncharacterized delta-60 repeat protein
MVCFPCTVKSKLVQIVSLVLLCLTRSTRAQLVFETPSVLEHTFAVPVNQVYSDRHGHVFIAYSASTTLITNNEAALFKGLPLSSPVTVQPDGGFVGRRDPIHVVSRCLPNGSVDPNFVSPQVNDGDTDSFHCIAAQPDGKLIVACGPLASGVSPFEGINQGLFRLNADGSFDPTFQMHKANVGQLFVLPDGRFYALTSGSIVRAFDLQPDGKIIVVGSFYTANGLIHPNIARFDTFGHVDPNFAQEPGGLGSLTDVRVQSDGSIIVANGYQVAKLAPDGTLDKTFTPPRTTQGFGGVGIDSSDRVFFNDGDNSLLVYGGRLRIFAPSANISTVFEQSSVLSGPWTTLKTLPANAPLDFPMSNFPGPGNAFFRIRPAP